MIIFRVVEWDDETVLFTSEDVEKEIMVPKDRMLGAMIRLTSKYEEDYEVRFMVD